MASSLARNRKRTTTTDIPDADALMVALIMAPGTFSRNRFFQLYQQEEIWRARRRAQVVRSLIKELTEPWPQVGSIPPHPQAIISEEREVDGDLVLSFSVPDMSYKRSARLSKIEASALRYCLHRAGKLDLDDGDRRTVEHCLSKLAPLSPSGELPMREFDPS